MHALEQFKHFLRLLLFALSESFPFEHSQGTFRTCYVTLLEEQ